MSMRSDINQFKLMLDYLRENCELLSHDEIKQLLETQQKLEQLIQSCQPLKQAHVA